MSKGAVQVGRLRVAALAAVIFTGCERSPPIVLGVATASANLDAVRLALEDELGRGAPILDTVVIAEGTNRAAPAIGAAEQLVAVEGLIAVVGHSNSAASLAASQIYNQHGVVQIAPNSSAVLYSNAGPYSFRLVPPDDRQGAFLAEQIAARLPPGSRLAVMYVNDDYGRGLRSNLLAALDTAAYDVVLQMPHLEDRVTADEVERGGLALAAPDALVWLGRGTVLNRLLVPIREAVGPIPILGGDATGTGGFRDNGDGRWDGVGFADFVDFGASPELRTFARRYETRFGRAVTASDVLTFDAIRLVFAGVEAGARSGPELRRFLVSLGRDREPFRGLSGPIAFDSLGDVDRPYVFRAVRPSDR